jgi:hypothetical protein
MAAAYRLTAGGIVRAIDGASIPDDPRNADWQAYEAWLAKGNTPDPITGPTPDAICSQIDAFRDARLATGYADAVTGKTWQCDPVSVGRWDALATQSFIAIQGGQGASLMIPLIAADNSITTHTATDTYALFSDRVAPWVQATVIYARTMKNSVLAGNPPADITQGWP